MDVGAEGQGDQEGSALPFSEVGHHCIRRNTISDNGECGLTGAGHTGTRVIGNIVERNNALGHRSVEEAGIKFHFCYDGVISGNLLRDNHGCGIWLDNEWYGTRVTGNVVCGSTGSGIFVEMGTGSCLVDNNIVAYTRAGDGIYTHDTSGVVIAHNLLIANAHFGVYLRYVTERMHRASDGATTMVGCSDNLVINNVMVDNYRGHVCLPGTSARSQRNRSDWNLFIGGTQWQWEALRFDVFALNGNDGRIPPDMLASLAGGAVPPFAIGLDQWRSATGNDISSMAPQVHHGPVENGAVRKGACGLAPNGVVTVCIDNPSSFTLLACPRVPRIDSDIFGVARPSGAVLPGPFAVLGKDAQVLPLWPLPPSGCEANGSAFALDP